ncbi:hypothetical protein VT84_30620 [Gemmata sp. SH-PL17]|uniref:hypothetical protein n=1 Tax=Gemmata sp. SH-PL17 TaxID=1630693 RepID=UPI00078E5337|nr:hypothetical protein [Gemmata sp. SH-PL17]AMV28787.1 hypothetical protein VT84_30620 [Gemmata sp. SH-PL17]
MNQSLADLLNSPGDFPFEGVTYKLGQPTVMQMGQYARWLEQRAREATVRATDLDDDTRRVLLKDVIADIAAGVYEWGSETCCKAMQLPRGQAKFLAIMLADQGVDDETADRMIASRLADVVSLIQIAVSDDPKAMAAALNQLGLPSNFVSSGSPIRRSTGRSKKSKRSRSRK